MLKAAELTFWYFSDAFPLLLALSAAASPPWDSFSTSARGFEPALLGAAAFLALGGVCESRESASDIWISDSSSSLSALAFFLAAGFAAGLAFNVVCVVFLAAGLAAAAFLGAALALGF